MHYFIAPDDSAFLQSSGLFPPPDGYEEVTAEEYQERLDAQRVIAEEPAAAALDPDAPAGSA